MLMCPSQLLGGVLIVEDHELLAATLALALRQHGLAVETATWPSPEAVVDVARQMAPVLVLLDLELGEVLGSGLDLVGPLTNVGAQVVMMTGVVDGPRLAACVEAGATGIVNKASGFARLVDAVRRVASGESLLAEKQRRDLLEELDGHRRADRTRLAPFVGLTPCEQSVLVQLVAGEPA
jgi:DNA-binding NarL/FixJ family response regulator